MLQDLDPPLASLPDPLLRLPNTFRPFYGAFAGLRPIQIEAIAPILEGRDLIVQAATGSGKSTLVHLIPRFYDAAAGGVQVDGIDVRGWEPEALRRHIGVVQQETILFSGTVFENIAYGRPNASQEEVVAAAKAA